MARRKRQEGERQLPLGLGPRDGMGRYTPWPQEGYHARKARGGGYVCIRVEAEDRAEAEAEEMDGSGVDPL
jgi:hypothetical protein